MPIQLRHNDRSKVGAFLERPALTLCRLTYGRVKHHNGHVWFDGRRDRHHLLEQLRLLLVTSGRVDDDHIETFCREMKPAMLRTQLTFAEFLHSDRGDRNRVGLGVRAVEGNLRLRSVSVRQRMPGCRPQRRTA